MKNGRNGFTLMELMVVAATVLIIAAIAIPSIARYYASCKNIDEAHNDHAAIVATDFSHVITHGNHSYIPVRASGTPDEYADDILVIVERFEKEYETKFNVTGWRIEKQQDVRGSDNFIGGIWVDHLPVR